MSNSGPKPAYRVPSMAEIDALPWNGLTAVSTFSGGGGSCTGYRMAGYRVAWANEFVDAARETYKANHPGSIVDGRDIRKVDPAEILDAIKLRAGDLDLFDGSPPCSAFSIAGKGASGWGKAKAYSEERVQVVDDLFFEYVRLVRGLRPRVFVAENVAGLIRGAAKGYFKLILAALKEAGYEVRAAVIDARWVGVPQVRRRLIFLGVRSDLGIAPSFPAPFPFEYSFRDAIEGLDAPVEPEASMERYAVGAEWRRLPIGTDSEKYFSLVRADPDLPSPTVTATSAQPGAASVAHPWECRKFSVAECKRVCAFPDDYVLSGTYSQQIERLGRAVPPLMMRAIAGHVRDNIFGKL